MSEKKMKLQNCRKIVIVCDIPDTMSLIRFVAVSLSVLDCLYPRDPLQPVTKKKKIVCSIPDFSSG